MTDFTDLRAQLRDAREQVSGIASQSAALVERLKQIDVRTARLNRVASAGNEEYDAQRAELERDRREAVAALEELRRSRREAVAVEAELAGRFGQFTDPREGIGRLDDGVPILMMPVRVETRFKQDELWVRVFPDDCWVDGFDPELSETELTNVRRYWTGIWQAGGIEDQERGAWTVLVEAHGSGRAGWIVDTYQPANLPGKPVKVRAEDVVLTVAVESALADADAVADYWRELWLADRAAAESAAVEAALEAAVGAARADEIRAGFVPANFTAAVAGGLTKADVAVSVAFVELPATATRESAWSSAPRATILPDRFVFLGYEQAGGQPSMIRVGTPVPSPLVVGPDPSAPAAEQLHHDEHGNLVIPNELGWLVDFDAAEKVGMAMRIPLTPTQASRGFARVLVLGVRLSADEGTAQTELETLLRHHSSKGSGLAVVPQGTPTNNTEAVGTGFDRLDDADESFDDRRQPLFLAQSGWLDKADGQWLAEYLGVDPGLFSTTHAADAQDQLTARAMNTALWPATMGYWMETMMSPVFDDSAIETTREFFTQFVIGAGACPAIRIGQQPYGILPATPLSRMNWLEQRPDRVHDFGQLQRLYRILLDIRADFDGIVPSLSRVGASGDPHALLLDVLGLHPGSVEWSQRYAESLKTLFNRLNLLGFGGLIQKLLIASQRQAARQKLTGLGHAGEVDPKILDLVFAGKHNLLKGGVIDDVPLSESEQLRTSTDDGRNYLEWLIDAANTSLDALYQQKGFVDNKRPAALLYLLLRHALQLGYSDVSIRLHQDAGLYSAAQAAIARADEPFLHVRDNNLVSESRYQPLYVAATEITGNPDTPVHEYIGERLRALQLHFHLSDQLAALGRLKDQPTAVLERALADHVDLCSYRLDAWLLGLANVQLAMMRGLRNGSETPARQGIHLGGYAWLEDLRPDRRELTPVELDEELAVVFGDGSPLLADSTNQGYVHAPSLNHAVAAAILRNGFLSNASPANRQTMAVNLTSERVRVALGIIEGIRAGQSMSSLLGYQFERGLHDRHGLAEVDKFIYKLRKEFPLRADRIKSTKSEPGDAIDAIEARNVIDGLALVEHLASTQKFTYPFGKNTLPDASPAEAAALNAEADRLRETHDAVADLALSEGAYQAVLGNYDRVASTYDAYARGNFPPEPDVVRTPLNGTGLTLRVGLHLDPAADPATSPVAGTSMTPRAVGEPGVNAWLAGVLPPPDQIGCVASYRSAATGTTETLEITLDQLGLQPADLLAVIREDTESSISELDDRVVQRVVADADPRPDVLVTIEYLTTQTAPYSVFELLPGLRAVRRLTTKSRPLRSSDLALMNESSSTQDAAPEFDKERLDRVRNALLDVQADLAAYAASIDGPLADLDNRRDEILTGIDTFIDDLAALLARVALFGIPQAGWAFAYDFRRNCFATMLAQAAELVTRWDGKLAEFDARVVEAGTAATDEEKFELLTQAERAVSTIITSPLPASPATYEADLVTVKRPAFVAKRIEFDAFEGSTRRGVSALLADLRAALPITDLDFVPFDLGTREDEIIRFAQDISAVATVLGAEVDRRLTASQDLFDEHDATAEANARVDALDRAAKVLLGEDFRIVPRFRLSAAQGDELANAHADSASNRLFRHLTTPADPAVDPVDFPVDEWMYGVARVREKLNAWEQTVMFTGALGRPEPELTAIQLPYVPDDHWLGLDFPADKKLDSDRLLYTAHYSTPFDKTKPQCGMLLDEWTETIPDQSIDTGIAFHYDRPNSEAPQTMLLVTPSEFRGAWQWNDLVDALNETLDLAKSRAVEPKHLDSSPYAPFLPATVLATQVRQLTIAMDLALNNKIALLED
ncbi:hypothetical protein [Kribbella sp. NPDC050470]|uniref:hypothetical protein n=1 Tax=unclassified Kribbella TaxID=2644121 RepID=UPI0037994367